MTKISQLKRCLATAMLAASLAILTTGCGLKTELVAPPAPVVQAPAVKEIRGVWVTNVDSDILTSKRKIAEGMEAMHKAGINVVYPVVWNKAQTLYPSRVAPTVTGVVIDPVYGKRDPLAELTVEAHARGMEVVPWFEFGFSSSFKSNGGPIVKARPQWAAIDPEGKLVNKNGFDWLNALDPEVQAFMSGLVLEVAEDYDIDGIQGDDRMPAMPTLGGYDEATKARYKAETGEDPPADIKEEKWVRWRAALLTSWLAGLRKDVKAIDEDLIVSMSPSYYSWALFEYLQDSYTWTNEGLVDSIHPQAYRYDLNAYKKIVDDLVTNQFTKEQLPLLAPGLLVKSGTYRIPNDYFLGAIAYNREKGINGEVHFFYTGLRANEDELLKLLAAGPYKEPAALPYRNELWRPGAIRLASISSSEKSVTYGIAAPVQGTFDVYVRRPENATNSLTFKLGKESRAVAPQTEEDWGWLKLATVTRDENEPVFVKSNGVGGEVMMLLNRKLSQTTTWK